MDRPNRFIYLGLFIVCASLLVSEILLTRIFSVCIWYHFAFLVISITMFGLGLGSMCVQLFGGVRKADELPEQLFYFSLMLGCTSIITPLFLFKTYIPYEIFNTFSATTTLLVAVAFFLSSLPFFFGGVITSLLFRKYAAHISKLYFPDLVGASVGCALSIIFLEVFGGATAVLLNAAFACMGALCFLLAGPRKIPPRLLALFCAVSIALLGLALVNIKTSILDVKYAKGKYRGSDEFSQWNSISRISVSKVLAQPSARWIAESIWGVSKNFKGQYPATRMIQIDADAGTFLTQFDNNLGSVDYVQYDPPSIVHRLKSDPRTLVIGAGGGKDVLSALSFGAKHVTAVELNPITVRDVMRGKYRKFSGDLYAHPKVTAIADEGRNFVATHKEKYDIIQLSYVDTSAATSGGAYVLAENNLYTTESFKEYLVHLEAGGIFSVCWVDVPGLYGAMRLVSLGIAALEGLGIEDVRTHIMVVTYAPKPDWIIRDILLKRTPFTQGEQETVLATCRELGFAPTYIPMITATTAPATADIKDDNDFLLALITCGNKARQELYGIFPLRITPTTDDSPFFFYQNKSKDFFTTLKTKVFSGYVVYSSGILVLSRVLLIGLIMVGLFYLIPMVFSAWSREVLPYGRLRVLPHLLYFSCLGMGFMFLEIVFLQKFLLFLGHPSHTLSTTLLSVLLFSGLGSLYTQRLSAQQPHIYIKRVLLCLLLIAMCYLAFLPAVLRHFMGHAKLIKVIITAMLLMPLSFLMGMPLPLAIKYLHTRLDRVIPWMWGVNGASSVLASIAGVILAMNIGYNFTLVVGCLFYLGAFIVAGIWFDQK